MDSLSVIPGSGYSLLELFGQAGGFQWPIVATLAAGLVILMHCVVRLYFDRRAAGRLMVLPVGRSGANDFEFMLSSCGDSLYARLLTGLLQMHRAGGAFQALGQEVRIVASAARESYARTERLVTYCSGAAGGLGLLGTLAGIYTLFSAGASDAQTIFAGIAIAVVSTLLGILVSIVLELLETITHGWTSRYVEAAEAWANQVRYSLMAKGEGLCADH